MNKSITLSEKDIARFWSKVEIGNPDECWEWKACKDNKGYGQLVFQQKHFQSHRFSWIIQEGDIPEDMKICHKCDNRSCVNPAHLFIGTQKENLLDMASKGRHANLKMTKEDVLNVRLLIKQKVPDSVIARRYGVSQSSIYYIKNGKNWSWLK